MAGGYRTVICWLLLPVLVARGQESQPDDDREPISARRIVKHFDFNERPLQNVGTIPLYWRPLRTEGFPRYLEGRFDAEVGHGSAPSFRLDLDGGSVAYQYEGNDIAVRPHSDYLVVAWIKTAGLVNARAYITTFFLDRRGNRIAGTERRSALVGGTGGTTDWQPIQVPLVGAVEGARYIGLMAWLTQQRVWDRRPRGPHIIEREDVAATAWFDDVTVYRLPRVALSSSSPGNVFGEHERVVLRPEVTDPDGMNLTASISVQSADGRYRDRRDVPIRSADEAPVEIVYEGLPVGLYGVRLVASTHGVPLVWRDLQFVRIPRPVNPPQYIGRGFGLLLDNIDAAALPGQRALLHHVRPELVKLPVWYSQRAVLGETYELSQAVDAYLQTILEASGNPVGVQMDEPSDVVAGQVEMRSMLDLMSDDPLAWKPLIAGTWARYTGLIHVWQVGLDGDRSIYLDDRLGEVLGTLKGEMSELMSEPLIAAPASVFHDDHAEPLADFRAVEVPASVAPDQIEANVRPLAGADPGRVWLTLQSPSGSNYDRLQHLNEYARRLVEAYFSRPGSVLVEAPWEPRIDIATAQVNPREEYLVLRTIADLLGGTTPVCRTNIDGQVECLVFDRLGQAVLFAWDDYAPAEGRARTLYLGPMAEQVDLWGRRVPIESVGDMQRFRVGPVPTFIINTPTWLMEFRRQFRITPPLIEANFSDRRRELVFKNTYKEPISGVLRLVSPEHWDIRPNRMSFALQPGEVFRQSLEVRFPINAEAGVKALLGEFSIDAQQRLHIRVPAWFELGLDGIDLETYAFRQGDNTIVRVSMTNRTDRPVSFDGDVILPRRQRLSRLFPNIAAGQSVTKEYVIDDAQALAGRRIRVHFNERQGSRIWNRVLTLP